MVVVAAVVVVGGRRGRGGYARGRLGRGGADHRGRCITRGAGGIGHGRARGANKGGGGLGCVVATEQKIGAYSRSCQDHDDRRRDANDQTGAASPSRRALRRLPSRPVPSRPADGGGGGGATRGAGGGGGGGGGGGTGGGDATCSAVAPARGTISVAARRDESSATEPGSPGHRGAAVLAEGLAVIDGLTTLGAEVHEFPPGLDSTGAGRRNTCVSVEQTAIIVHTRALDAKMAGNAAHADSPASTTSGEDMSEEEHGTVAENPLHKKLGLRPEPSASSSLPPKRRQTRCFLCPRATPCWPRPTKWHL